MRSLFPLHSATESRALTAVCECNVAADSSSADAMMIALSPRKWTKGAEHGALCGLSVSHNQMHDWRLQTSI
eukprot:m.95600 g.95600  ORF g.95600 m.95600 type:complete len:72 (-) comp51296_c0_seq20:211-426(-)